MFSILSRHSRIRIVLLSAALVAAVFLACYALPGRAGTDADGPCLLAVRSETGVAPSNRRARLAGAYAAQVIRVIDGDTVEARVAVWLGQEITTRVRLRGVDAPELRGACDAERDLAIAARARLEQLIGGGAVILTGVGGDKYFGRVTGDLMVGDRNPADILLTEGLVRPYRGGRRSGWCNLAQGRQASNPGN